MPRRRENTGSHQRSPEVGGRVRIGRPWTEGEGTSSAGMKRKEEGLNGGRGVIWADMKKRGCCQIDSIFSVCVE